VRITQLLLHSNGNRLPCQLNNKKILLAECW
jgi:hypothetical protein